MWIKNRCMIIIQWIKFKVTLRLGWSWGERKEKRRKKKGKEMEKKMLPLCMFGNE